MTTGTNGRMTTGTNGRMTAQGNNFDRGRNKIYDNGNKIYDNGNKIYDNGNNFMTQGTKNYDNGNNFESDNKNECCHFDNWGRRQYKKCKINGEVKINNDQNTNFVDDRLYSTNNNTYMTQQIAKELRKAAERIEKLGMNESAESEQIRENNLKFNHNHESEYYQHFGNEAINKYQKYYKNMK